MKRLFLILLIIGFATSVQARPPCAPVTSYEPVQVVHTGSATISAGEVYGHTHVFTATATASLPAAVAGMHTALVMTAAAVLTIDPNGTEYIVFDRASLGAGVTLVSDGVAYAVVYLECVVTGYWIAYVNMGTFAGGS